EIGPGYPRFHLPLPPVRHTFVRVNLNLLKQAAIFQDLDDGELARVSEVCREQKFAVSQQVFKEGEPGNRSSLSPKARFASPARSPGRERKRWPSSSRAPASGRWRSSTGPSAPPTRSPTPPAPCSRSPAPTSNCCSISTATSPTRCCGRSCGCCRPGCA